MFQNKDFECVGFESKWKLKSVSIEACSQTNETESRNVGSNTKDCNEIEIQTDVVEEKPVEYDETQLAEFLSKVYSNMHRALDDGAATADVFKNYKPQHCGDAPNEVAKLSQKIDLVKSFNGEKVSAMSWNATGNSIAVACTYDHTTWCHHSGSVQIYTFNLRNETLPEVPQKTFQTPACVTTLKFHPKIPAIIAGGTYAGEIIIWNIQKDDNDNVMIRVNGHEELLTQISWINDVDENKDVNPSKLLATASLDGFLNIWKFNNINNTLTIKEKFKIKCPLFGRLQRKSELSPEIANKVDRGIIAFDFSKFASHMFVVAAEGGLVVRCSLLSPKPVSNSNNVQISDPVYKYYKSHEGEVTSIAFSPNRSELFATCGTDGEIRFYTIEEEEPAQVIFVEKTLLKISWILYEEKLLAGCGSSGNIELFDVLGGKKIDYSVDGDNDFCNIIQMEINFQRGSVVAVGTNKGLLQLWHMPWHSFIQKSD